MSVYHIDKMVAGEVISSIETASRAQVKRIWRHGFSSENYAAIVYCDGQRMTTKECIRCFDTFTGEDVRRRNRKHERSTP